MNERFTSVWEALPDNLRDTEDQQPGFKTLLASTGTMASKAGYSLTWRGDWWHLDKPGSRARFGSLENVRNALLNARKTAQGALAGAACTVDLAKPENALQAVFVAMPIATSDWPDAIENATPARGIEDGGLSNEF